MLHVYGTSLGPLGILGGGQLARMTIQAASELGIECVVAERFGASPASKLTPHEIVFQHGWDDPEALASLARQAPVVTLENEFVDAAVLRRLESHGVRVLPTPDCVGTVQDKLIQKQALAAMGVPLAPFQPVSSAADVASAADTFGWPLMLKARRDAYDGYGNALVQAARDIEPAMRRLGWPERALYAEAFLRFDRELACMVVRSPSGQQVTYPVVETRQDPERHICREVLVPAPVALEVLDRARSVAEEAVAAVNGIGAFGVEMFLLLDGQVLVNELAPRPHNTGHYSIEACDTSQFANHVRAVLDLPLGKPTPWAPAAAMVNLLGTGGPAPTHALLARALAVPGVSVHVYGKAESRPGRKMGHVTALGLTLEDALERARRAAAHLTL